MPQTALQAFQQHFLKKRICFVIRPPDNNFFVEMPRSNALDASEALFIHPSEPGFHCMGYAKTTRDGCCHNPINQANRARASRILRDLDGAEPKTSSTRRLLRELAPIILCQRRHQWQDDELYYELKRRMRAASSDRQHDAYNRLSNGDLDWQPRSIIRSRGLNDPWPRKTENTRSSRSSGTSRATGANTNASHRTTSTSSRTISSSSTDVTRTIRGRASSGQGNLSADALTTPATTVTIRALELMLQQAIFDASRTSEEQDTESPNPSTTRTKSRSIGGAQCSTRHARRHPLHECPICLDKMETSQKLVWCKAQCGQNYHDECFEGWRTSERRQGNDVTCGHW